MGAVARPRVTKLWNFDEAITAAPAALLRTITAAASSRASISASPRSTPSTLIAVSRPSAARPCVRDDGDGEIVGQSHAGRRIDDVGVAAAAGVEVLFGGVRRSRRRHSSARRRRGNARRDVRQVVQRDAPAARPGGRIAEREVAADRDHRRPDTACREIVASASLAA